MGKKYSPEIHKFIAENVQGRTTKELVKLVNEKFGPIFTESKMKSYKTNHRLKSGTLRGLPAEKPTKLFPKEIKDFIEKNHDGIGPKDMTELLNKTFGTKYTYEQMKSYYKNHKLNSGLTGCFEKGHVPWNKGLKGIKTGGIQTQFKKGHIPYNRLPINSERISKDGYVYVKVQDGHLNKNWKLKHVLIWEQKNGPLPKGHAVIFGDGNNSNFDINNLILVTRRQLLTLNRKNLIQKDADLTRTAVIITDLYHKISARK